MTIKTLKFTATEQHGKVSALLDQPEKAFALYVLAHGAGTNMRHASLEAMSAAFAQANIATFRYNFPYMENGRGGLNSAAALKETVRSAVKAAREAAPGLPLFAGGRSMGGRMTSLAASEAPLPGVQGIIFAGFPLYPAGKPSTERAEHLKLVGVPMLFLQGTRDNLADLELLRPVVKGLGNRAALHVIEGADHSFKVLKRSERTEADVLSEMANAAAAWIRKQI
jgi:hypothetical protein